MLEEMKIRLIVMFLDGCKYDDWKEFNCCCKRHLTTRQYVGVKRMNEYKSLFNHFGRI